MKKRQHLLVVKRMIYLLECIKRIKFIMVGKNECWLS